MQFFITVVVVLFLAQWLHTLQLQACSESGQPLRPQPGRNYVPTCPGSATNTKANFN